MTAAERARLAWLSASRDTELDRWRDLYDQMVPRPPACPAAPADECADERRTPILNCPAAAPRAMAQAGGDYHDRP